MEPYKLNVKIGEHEFNSEGAAEDVKEAFSIWKELIASTNHSAAPKEQRNGFFSAGSQGEAERLNRLFLHDPNKDLVSVKIFPRGNDRERDTVLLILLGYKLLKDQHEVMATKLTPAMRQSGCKLDRIDRIAAKYVHQGLINKGGIGKSGRYSLTNTGVAKATEIMEGLLG